MFLTDEEFRAHVSGAVKTGLSDMAGYWDSLCQKAHESAYFDVRGALLARGFTAAQVDQWPRGAEYERDIGLYWVGIRSDLMENDLERLKLLDRRQELMTVMVELPNGQPQDPTGPPQLIYVGLLDDSCDRWTRNTPL